MNVIAIVLAVVLIVISIVLSIIILLQSKRSAGLGAISASSSTGGDSYMGSSVDGTLEKYTKIGGALFMIIAFVINIIV